MLVPFINALLAIAVASMVSGKCFPAYAPLVPMIRLTIAYSGNTPAHCGNGCQPGFGACNGTSTLTSFQAALKNGKTDEVNGGEWYWDPAGPFFWTWDTPALVSRKFDEIVNGLGIGGVSAWSLGEDSNNYSLIKAIQSGVRDL